MKRTFLLSYPRCGRHLLFYCINYLYGETTPLEDYSTPTLKKHISFNHVVKGGGGMDGCEKLILAVRNYKEFIPRHFEQDIITLNEDITAFLESNPAAAGKSLNHFIDNLEYFDVFEGEKLLIYYEDIIENFDESMIKLYEFLELENDEYLNDLIKNKDSHLNRGVKLYDERIGSRSKGNDILFHSKNFSVEQLKEFDRFYRSEHPIIFEKYLKRYKEI